jgi:hypothetical protein
MGVPNAAASRLPQRMRVWNMVSIVPFGCTRMHSIHVFAPEYELVVSSVARAVLLDVPEIEFERVIFQRLFSYPYRAGDFSFWDDLPDYNRQQKFFDKQKNVPQLHSRVGDFFELVAPPIKDIRNRFHGLRDVAIEIDPKKSGQPLKLSLSVELLDRIPVFKVGGFIMRDDVFVKLAPFIDWTYFTRAEAHL